MAMFIDYQLIRLKHLCLLLRQTPEGWPLPQLIMEYCALREFLKYADKDMEAATIVDVHGSDWIKGLK
jgi:hypothetical protein